jgi:chromosome segregation ATPase
MSDFEHLVRETGFLFKADVGQGLQELVVTVSELGLTGTQVASVENLALAGFVKTERLRAAEEALATVQARLKDVEANHAALKQDFAGKPEALKQDHADELADEREAHRSAIAELERQHAAQLAELREALSVRQDVWAHEKSRLMEDHRGALQARDAAEARLKEAHAGDRAQWDAERAALEAAHAQARAGWEREAAEREDDHQAELVRVKAVHTVETTGWERKHDDVKHECAVWEARHRAEHEGIVARNEGAGAEANPYTGDDDLAHTAHEAWRHGWMLRDGLLRLNSHAATLQAERDNLVRAMEKARPEIERLLEDNQRLKTSTEALREEFVRLNTEHEAMRQALEQCEAKLQAWREEG